MRAGFAVTDENPADVRAGVIEVASGRPVPHRQQLIPAGRTVAQQAQQSVTLGTAP